MATDMAEGKADSIAVHGPARPAGGRAAAQRPGSEPASTAGSRRPGLVRREDLPASPLPV